MFLGGGFMSDFLWGFVFELPDGWVFCVGYLLVSLVAFVYLLWLLRRSG